MSQGEQVICKLLTQAGISFTREKTFSDLKHGLFRFDFYIQKTDGTHAVIEFNGIQHYEFVPRFYKKPMMWRKAQEYDRRKISYCLANNIPIYIIPYWDLPTLREPEDLFREQYLATTRWHNDNIYLNKKDRL